MLGAGDFVGWVPLRSTHPTDNSALTEIFQIEI